MAFKDNIGVQEELKVQLEDCTPQLLTRSWVEELLEDLKGLRDPLNPRQRLEEVISKVQSIVDTHHKLFG